MSVFYGVCGIMSFIKITNDFMQSPNNKEMPAKGGPVSGRKQKILKYALFGLTLIAGFFSWFFLFHSPNYSGMMAWIIPGAFFFLYATFLSLAAILVRQEIAFEFVIILSLAFSFVFVFSKWHLVFVILGMLLMLSAVREIRKDLDMNIKIDFWKSLYMGRFRMIIALSLIISSQYFCMINASNGNKEKFIPKFDISPIAKRFVEPVLVVINPNFRTMKDENLTVNQFIIKSKQGGNLDMFSDVNFDNEIDEQISKNLPVEQREILKQEAIKQILDSGEQLSKKNQELIMQEGRKQLSQMVGYELSGNEKISDVFVGFINSRINDYFQPHKANGGEDSHFFSYIIAVILFLTVWPSGVALSVAWFVLIIIIFKIMAYFKLVEIKTVTVQREMIV